MSLADTTVTMDAQGRKTAHRHEQLDRDLSEDPLPVLPVEHAIIAEKYEVLQQIGSGGSGTVFKVQHTALCRTMALKLLQEIKPDSVLRFKQEAQASSRLEHPNIVKVHDFGTINGMPYMTMDYHEGLPLSEVIKQSGILEIGRIIRTFGQICTALAHAHEHGVVHRDLKPSNILIRGANADTEQAIVLDFGIAKIVDCSGKPNASSLTQTGQIFGTPIYMSPEQCHGGMIDARSDIYSLGCVMYEAATGRPPFQGVSVYDIIHKQINDAPPPFPESLRKTRSGRRLEALILKAMAKSPDDRQQYMLELASELKAIQVKRDGFWADLRSISTLISRRSRAAQRAEAQPDTKLRLLSASALMLSLVFLSLPGLMDYESRELRRNQQISTRLTSMFDMFEKKNSAGLPMWSPEHTIYATRKIARLCKSDRLERAQCDKLVALVAQGLQETLKYEARINENLTEQGITLQSAKEIGTTLTGMFGIWNKANREALELLNLSASEINQHQSHLNMLAGFRAIVCMLAAFIQYLLAVLLWESFSSASQTKPKDK